MQVKKKSQKQERSVAKEIGGKTVVASGAKWFADSDVRSDKFLVECKTTSKDYFSITTALWEKILKEATKDHGRIPLMVIDLNHDSVHEGKRFVVFSAYAFDEVPSPHDCTYIGQNMDGGDPKSFRLHISELEELSEECEMEIKGRLFNIHATSINKVRHLLFYTTMEEFKRFYKKELEE